MLLKTHKTFAISKCLRAKLRARSMVRSTGERELFCFSQGMGLAEALAPVLAKLAGVKTLDLSKTDLCEFGARVLACILRDTAGAKIECLNLRCNSLGCKHPSEEYILRCSNIDAATRFTSALAFLSTHEPHPPESGIAALVDALLATNTVKNLNLGLNLNLAFGDRRVPLWRHLLRLARESKSLEGLMLGENRFEDSWSSELVTTVSQNLARPRDF